MDNGPWNTCRLGRPDSTAGTAAVAVAVAVTLNKKLKNCDSNDRQSVVQHDHHENVPIMTNKSQKGLLCVSE